MIDPTARIDCKEFIHGPGLIVRAHAEIYGDRVVLGRDCFIDEYAVIGGGSAGYMTAGNWFHMGMFSQVNTARPVTIGDEVGLGIGTRVFTHGAYLSEWDGFPVAFDGVEIGNRVWIPNGIVNPGVRIGSDTVIASGSIVTKDLAGGAVYAGAPAQFVRWINKNPPGRTQILKRICEEARVGVATESKIVCAGTVFYVGDRDIAGPVTEESERLRNQLRRHGIRFPVDARDGEYRRWDS